MKHIKEDNDLVKSILINSKEKNLSEKELYNRYYKITYNKVRKYNYDIESAKDIATDILLKVFGSLEKFDSKKCSFNSWVLKISSNHLIDLYRKNKNRLQFVSYTSTVASNNVNIDNNIGTIPTTFTSNSTSNWNVYWNHVTTTSNQEDHFINKEDYNTAIKTLSEPESDIIRLKYEYGYSNAEIGDLYNVSKATVSNKINYLKKKIQKNLTN